VNEKTAYDIGVEAYTYLYPMVLMEVTRRQITNVEHVGDAPLHGPMNSFVHVPAFPPADFRAVVRPNFDTLYSSAWLDLTAGPMIVSVPESPRYYLLPTLDMWTDVFASPGTRTTGNGPGNFAFVGPGWSGDLPDGIKRIDAPTPMVWIIGRTQTNGVKDYETVNGFQSGISLTPLSTWGHEAPTPTGVVDPSVDAETAPLEQVFAMEAAPFFALASDLLRTHPPHYTDQPLLARMERAGFVAGQAFDLAAAETEVRGGFGRAVPDAQTRARAFESKVGWVRNNWQMNTETMGCYGADYLKRAVVALIGLGANLPEDAIYPMAFTDSEGKPFDGGSEYLMHFDQEDLPPTAAFWSLTLYDAEGFQVTNRLDRFAIGDRDELTFNADGSLDLQIRHESPGEGMESNWLPAPEGGFNLCLRLYYPEPQAIDGTWAPPGVKRVA
jgi:hypothetical protein